ncbi:TolC family protein [Clostridium aminobutyricum]|uniref:TolC family protein n=1 Tax=Clostridium aminobutyricum TaxID=33953 RepID=A0A939IJG3_CLOAM|nr:TolC family protein [Clostridium aminobutyricum]MBN7774056.1 TolC family protein [Clostridium aminobutyricum]
MRKQIWIVLLAFAIVVTSVHAAAFAATGTSDSSTSTSSSAITTQSAVTSGSAIATGTAISADSAITTTDSAITTVPAINTSLSAIADTGTMISISLDDAYKKLLAESPNVKLAQLTLDNEIAAAKGYSEKLSALHQAEKDTSGWGVDTSSKPMLQANKAYGLVQAPKNYEATINSIKAKAYEMYYTYKYTEAQVQVAKDNLDRSQAVYNSTMLKYKLGTVSKLDTLNAETTLNTAKDQYNLAVNGLEQVKLNFNLFMGYNIHQKLTLTDSLSDIALPSKTLDTSIQEALTNRNEISEANYNVQMTQLALNNVKDYPSSSATYQNAKVALMMAQEAQKTEPSKIEIDVRTKYMDMVQKHEAVKSGKVSYDNSKETVRLGQLQYDSGVITITDLSGIMLNAFQTQQEYYKAMLDYNLAVDQYNLASGVGTATATIK